MIKTNILLLFLPMLLISSVVAENRDDSQIYGFLAGTYITIGKEMDSQKMYCGKTVFKATDDHLVVTRYINGKIISGIGKIKRSRCCDNAYFLEIKLHYNQKKIEIVYLWRSDLDNYARLSGYVYEPGKWTNTPGLEALFIDQEAK